MKKYLVCGSVFLLILFVSCTNNSQNNENSTAENLVIQPAIVEKVSDNILLPKNVLAKTVMNFNNDNQELTKNFNYKKYIKDLFKQVNNNKLTVYDAFTDIWSDSIKQEIKNETIVEQLKSTDIEGVTGLAFHEKWFFNNNSMSFLKEVFAVVPILYTKTETRTLVSPILYLALQDNDSDYELLAKDVIYSVPLNNKNELIQIYGIDKEQFIKSILVKLFNSEIKAYDDFNSINGKDFLSVQDLKYKMGETVDTIMVYNPETKKDEMSALQSEIEFSELLDEVLFVEDWYYSKNSFMIKKQVKSITLIRTYNHEESGVEMKTIVCTIPVN